MTPMNALSRRTAALVAGGVAAVVLAACTTQAARTNGPVHLRADSVEDLRRGCGNIRDGYPDAAKYTGAGPHTMAVFAKNLVTDTGPSGPGQVRYELANSEIPDAVLAMPESPAEVALLACGETRPGDEQLNVCSYDSVLGAGGGGHEVPLYSQHYTFTIYELRTGRVVDTRTLDSRMRQPVSSCPLRFAGGGKVYAKAQPYELADLFEDLVTGPAG